ncbi:Piso0_004851 [Millerozyma farinosa CBS 7064]|uniref:Piso0_004851 protein n=1 Tax=Pichia sorbitophila (strain ATCC MYA-4447 / BCRC 22081 / CBS 7064 / NBRC 10061 / NRRL Y-12695) TaxID=559304 RepID=G8Y3K1_PICSO|nr:Piso0_004851 [Millerozyma farinosa CBS 7064]
MDNSKSKNVYIGNIPFDHTEEQVLDIARSVGPVLDLKLLFDSMTGKSKGYAFVRYSDHETAASAVRNLNNLTIGNRSLKCSFSNDNSSFNDNSSVDKLPALPFGVQLFPNQTPPQAISNALSSLDQHSALQLMREARQMSQSNPTLMKKLLDQCPQLAYALVETSLLLNITTPELIKLCVNSKQVTLESLTPDHVQLLKHVDSLKEQDLESLTDDQKSIIRKMKEEISKGTYGTI